MLETTQSARHSDSKLAVAAPAPTRRDMRLDVFRGLALVMIYINHVPGTVFEHFTNRNFGFSDAAEGFVLMSGIAAGIAYSSTPPPDRPWHNARRAWARSRTLYMTHIVTTMMAVGISCAAARWFGAQEMIERNNLAPLFEDPVGVLIGIPALTHQLGYFNILPLYAVLLVATPALVWLGRRRPGLLLALSVAVWAAAGQTRTNFPAYPNPGGWFFNPFSWQLIFVVGLLSGLAMRNGERLVPVTRRWLVATIAFLVFVLVWSKFRPLGLAGERTLHGMYELGAPFWTVGFDKTYLAVPRLLHALALFYLISALPWFRHAAESHWARPLALMGQHALPVFATGSVLSILGQSIREAAPPSFLLDAWVVAGGLLIQLLLAAALARLATAPARTRA